MDQIFVSQRKDQGGRGKGEGYIKLELINSYISSIACETMLFKTSFSQSLKLKENGCKYA